MDYETIEKDWGISGHKYPFTKKEIVYSFENLLKFLGEDYLKNYSIRGIGPTLDLIERGLCLLRLETILPQTKFKRICEKLKRKEDRKATEFEIKIIYNLLRNFKSLEYEKEYSINQSIKTPDLTINDFVFEIVSPNQNDVYIYGEELHEKILKILEDNIKSNIFFQLQVLPRHDKKTKNKLLGSLLKIDFSKLRYVYQSKSDFQYRIINKKSVDYDRLKKLNEDSFKIKFPNLAVEGLWGNKFSIEFSIEIGINDDRLHKFIKNKIAQLPFDKKCFIVINVSELIGDFYYWIKLIKSYFKIKKYSSLVGAILIYTWPNGEKSILEEYVVINSKSKHIISEEELREVVLCDNCQII